MSDSALPVSETSAEPAESAASAPRLSSKGTLQIVGCGFLMGAADIVPGVSGGTMALILGIYERLLTAISRCDRELVNLVLHGRLKAAADRLDLKFVIPLGCGILLGAGGLATIMKLLLTDYRSLTYAAFAGLILASSLLVARRVRAWQLHTVGGLILGTVIALRLVTLPALQNPPETYWYLFLCGMVGISAMILPGISGAFILLLLRRYDLILDSIRSLTHADFSVPMLTTLAVFSVGCLTGLLMFSRVLRWLLATRHDATLSVLCGFMIGSLYRLWPFQRDLPADPADPDHPLTEFFIPPSLTSDVALAMFVFIGAVCLVLVMDTVAERARRL